MVVKPEETSGAPLTKRARQRARKAIEDHPLTILLGLLVVVAALVATVAIAKAVVRRRRKTLLEQTLGYVEELGEHRDRLAARLRDLVERNIDGGAIAKEIGGRVKAVRSELKSVDAVVAALKEQGERLAERVRR